MINPVQEKICKLRKKGIKQVQKKRIDLNKPVAYWSKPDRLINEIGKELTIILRTRGCSHALGDSGGCSMCGYVQDSYIQDIPQESILNQFNVALESKMEEISTSSDNYVLKIFNSGSFLDDTEITPSTRQQIYEKIQSIDNITELIVESRPEYVNETSLKQIKEVVSSKYVEIGIGLESASDHVRNAYINKGFSASDFQNALEQCHAFDIGVKAYLLFKPLFMTEIAAIDDCVESISYLKNLGVDSISINPMNIQRFTLVERLWYQNRYRPPWYYSLFEAIRQSVNRTDLKSVRILSDPSGAGSKRGIHNCLDRECNQTMKGMLEKFVLNQDLTVFKGLEAEENQCSCRLTYELQKKFI